MGQITSGVGLISGINYADLIDQLLSIEARPKTIIETRNATLSATQVAFQSVNAKLLAHKLSVSTLLNSSTFSNTSATSSDESVLTATSSKSATPGTYEFTVDQLVTTQQVISKGYADSDATALGAGTLTFEFGDARLDSKTSLSLLNGGDGVKRGDIRITDRSGASAIVDLSRALTVDDVIDQINSAGAINVTASIADDGLVIDDNTGSTATSLQVQEVGAGTTAADLGLTAAAVGDKLTGDQINLIKGSTALSNLNDGLGVRILAVQDDFQITTRDGNTHNIDLAGATTIDDVIATIDSVTSSDVVTTVNAAGTGLLLTDTTVGATFGIAALYGSNAAADLGIEQTNATGQIDSGRLIAAINSKLVKHVNGGSGATLGTIRINNRAATSTDIDISSAGSISEVVDLINNAGAGVTASLNAPGNGVLLTDTTGSTASNLTVTDESGTGAVDLNIAADVAANTIDSGNLQYQYLSDNTTLVSMNGGRGVSKGNFKITDSAGKSKEVLMSDGSEITLYDVIKEINSRNLAINARINDNGDGILIEDTGPGTVKLKIEELGSTTARDLGILGEAANAGDDLDGTFERTVTVDAADTLSDVAASVNSSGLDIAAVVINDGSPTNPYRINFTSKNEGRSGAYVFDDNGLGMGATTLVEAQNSVVFYGSSDPAKSIAISSPSNTLTTVVPGATIDLKGTSTSSVQVTINRDDSAITTAITNFVDNFNGVIDTIDEHDRYNVETETRGLLLGDTTVGTVRSRLFRLATGRHPDLTGQFTALSQVGIRVSGGGKLSFDQTKLTAALASDRDAVEQLFTLKDTTTDPTTGETTVTAAGAMARLEEALERFTDAVDGSIQSRVDAIDDQIELGNNRIAALDDRLDAKRLVLETQFRTLEQTLATLQSQSSSLGNLQPILLQSRNSSGSLLG